MVTEINVPTSVIWQFVDTAAPRGRPLIISHTSVAADSTKRLSVLISSPLLTQEVSGEHVVVVCLVDDLALVIDGTQGRAIASATLRLTNGLVITTERGRNRNLRRRRTSGSWCDKTRSR